MFVWMFCGDEGVGVVSYVIFGCKVGVEYLFDLKVLFILWVLCENVFVLKKMFFRFSWLCWLCDNWICWMSLLIGYDLIMMVLV